MPVTPIRLRPIALLGVGLAIVLAVVGLLSARGSKEPAQFAVVTMTPTTAPTPTPTPQLRPTSIVPDGPVAFRVCGEISGYRKLTPAEMQSVFTNTRFGDGAKPGPFYWAVYESDYYWIQDPQAISANVENVALSVGTTTTSGTAPTVRPRVCPVPDRGQFSERFQALWLYDHHVVAMQANAGVLTVEVESRPGSWENVELPDPSPPRSNDAVLFTGLRVVDGAGHVLLSRGIGALASETDDSGRFVSGTLGSLWPPGTLSLRVAADLEFMCGEAPRGAAHLTLTPANKGASMTVQAAACSGAWEVAARVHLDPGDWTIGVDGDAYYIVLPKDGPRP